MRIRTSCYLPVFLIILILGFAQKDCLAESPSNFNAQTECSLKIIQDGQSITPYIVNKLNVYKLKAREFKIAVNRDSCHPGIYVLSQRSQIDYLMKTPLIFSAGGYGIAIKLDDADILSDVPDPINLNSSLDEQINISTRDVFWAKQEYKNLSMRLGYNPSPTKAYATYWPFMDPLTEKARGYAEFKRFKSPFLPISKVSGKVIYAVVYTQSETITKLEARAPSFYLLKPHIVVLNFSDNDNVKDIEETADDRLDQQNPTIEDCNKIISMKPNSAEAYYNRGNVYGKAGQFKQAIDDYSKAISLKPDYVDAYLYRGTVYSKLGQNQSAIKDFSKIISLKPKFVEAYYNRGTVYANLGQNQPAIDDFNKAISVKPNYSNAYAARGVIYARSGQHQKAILDLNKAISLKPDLALAYFNRGAVYANLGQNQPAIDDFNKAISLKPDYADAYYSRGIIYVKLSQYQKAMDDFTKAISLKPDYAESYEHRGMVYVKLGKNKLAIEDYNKAISLKPDFAEAYSRRGGAYVVLSKNKLAIEDFNKAISLKHDYADAYLGRGLVYSKENLYGKAIEDFNKAISLKPDFAVAYLGRGAIYLIQGNKKIGCADIRKACEWGECKASEDAEYKELCR